MTKWLHTIWNKRYVLNSLSHIIFVLRDTYFTVSTEYNTSNGSQNCPTNAVCAYPGNNITITYTPSEISYEQCHLACDIELNDNVDINTTALFELRKETKVWKTIQHTYSN